MKEKYNPPYPLELQRFVVDNEQWEEELSLTPYHLKINREDGLVLFKYNQILSDFSYQICREARGVILYEGSWDIAAVAFNKFFNYGEAQAADIDWSTARIQEKIDGSIVKLWWNRLTEQWQLSTNGTIDAFKASLEFSTDAMGDFGHLVMEAFEKYDFRPQRHNLSNTFTYIFEIASPYNRIVVPYREIELYHIGTRHNPSAEEAVTSLPGIPKPKEYRFSSLEETMAAARELDYTQEGFVVVDGNWNRVKIKGEDYLRVHKIRGESIPTDRRILDLIRNEQADDFIGLFPEYSDRVTNIQEAYKRFLDKVNQDVEEYVHNWYLEPDRKKYAMEFAKKCTYPPLMFQLKDGKVDEYNVDEFFRDNVTADKMLKVIGM